MRTRSTTNPSSQSARSNVITQSNPTRSHLPELSAAPGDPSPFGPHAFHNNECAMRPISGCSSQALHLFSCGHHFCTSCIVGDLRSQTSCKPKRSLRQNGNYKNSKHRLTEDSLSAAMAKRKLKCFCKHTRQSLIIAAQWRRRSKIAFCRGLLSSEVELGWQGCGQKESPGQEYVMWCFSSKR
jgi:hypothetical protein